MDSRQRQKWNSIRAEVDCDEKTFRTLVDKFIDERGFFDLPEFMHVMAGSDGDADPLWHEFDGGPPVERMVATQELKIGMKILWTDDVEVKVTAVKEVNGNHWLVQVDNLGDSRSRAQFVDGSRMWKVI